MSRWLVIVGLLVAGCINSATQTTTTTIETATTTNAAVATTSSVPAKFSTTTSLHEGGQLVQLDPLSLEPVPGLDPIPFPADSWNILSTDGSLFINFEWDDAKGAARATAIDITEWKLVGEFDVGPLSGHVIYESTLYTYDHENGALLAHDVGKGIGSTLDDWPSGLSLWDGLHVVSGSRLAALGTLPTESTESAAEYSIFVYDSASAVTTEIAVGKIERINEKTGVFDGDFEIPESDSPGVVWGNDRVFIVHADDPEVLEVEFETGEARTHYIEVTSWWDRLLANWMPTASAKGPSLGTYTSAALSPDGRYLYVSGNRQVVESGDHGTLIETSEHLGLTVIDTESWMTIEGPDLSIQFIRSVGGGAIGVDTVSLQPWVDDLYILSVEEPGEVTSRGPFTLKNGGCDLASDPSHLICFDHGSEVEVQIIDVDTQKTIARRAIGSEDLLHSNGLLEDWTPTTNN